MLVFAHFYQRSIFMHKTRFPSKYESDHMRLTLYVLLYLQEEVDLPYVSSITTNEQPAHARVHGNLSEATVKQKCTQHLARPQLIQLQYQIYKCKIRVVINLGRF